MSGKARDYRLLSRSLIPAIVWVSALILGTLPDIGYCLLTRSGGSYALSVFFCDGGDLLRLAILLFFIAVADYITLKSFIFGISYWISALVYSLFQPFAVYVIRLLFFSKTESESVIREYAEICTRQSVSNIAYVIIALICVLAVSIADKKRVTDMLLYPTSPKRNIAVRNALVYFTVLLVYGIVVDLTADYVSSTLALTSIALHVLTAVMAYIFLFFGCYLLERYYGPTEKPPRPGTRRGR